LNLFPLEDWSKLWNSRQSLWFEPNQSPIQKKLFKDLQARMERYPHLVWFSSSGSTSDGGIKFFGHSRRGFEVAAHAANLHLKTTSNDVVVNVLPLFHVGGFSSWLRAQVGGYTFKTLAIKKWSPKKFHEALQTESASLTSMVPTQLHDMVSLGLPAPKKLRAVLIGGGRLSQSLYEKALSLGWPVLPSYGLTELGSQVATAPLESLKGSSYPELHWLSHIENISKDSRGDFWIKSESSAKFQASVSLNGQFSLEWKSLERGLCVEDLLEIDTARKTLVTQGRKTSVVKVKGELISLDHLNLRLQKFLELKLSQIEERGHPHFFTGWVLIARPHSREENEVVLFVEKGENGFQFQFWTSLLDEFNRDLKSYEQISRIEWISQIPRTELGKIQINKISSQFDRSNGLKFR